MALNSAKNFAISSVANAILIGDSTITLVGGGGALFPIAQTPPATSFYATVYNPAIYSDPSLDPNVEIVLVTNNASNILTVTRGQQGTSAAAHPNTSAVLAGVTRSDLALIASGIGDYALDTGSTNAYVTAIDLYPSALSVGMQASVKIANANTGTSTLNHAGTGVKTITRNNGSTLQTNDLIVGMIANFTYDGTNWQLTNPNIGSSNLAFATNVQLVGKSLGTGTAVTATVAAGVATVTHTSHGYSQGDDVVLAGATSGGSIGDFNQLHVITGVTTNTYTFNTTATVSITGSPVEMFWFKGVRCLNSTLIKNITRGGTGQYLVVFTNTQSDAFYGQDATGNQSANVVVQFGGDGNNPPSTTQTGFIFHNQTGTSEECTAYLRISFNGII